jgi:hypothetical protein
MAFPDMPTYRRLAVGVTRSLRKLDVDVIFVGSDATVNWRGSGDDVPRDDVVDAERS